MTAARNQDVLRETQGALSWEAAAGLDDGALAVVRRQLNSGGRSYSLVRLDSDGQLIARSDNLPVVHPHSGGAISITGKKEALVAVYDRQTVNFKSNGMEYGFSNNQPRWFRCSWTNKKLKFEEVDFWRSQDIHQLNAVRNGSITGWSMVKTTHAKQPVISSTARLAFGFGSAAKPPVLRESEVSCVSVAHLAETDKQLLALVIPANFKEAALWRLTEDGAAAMATISPPEQGKGEISMPALFRLSDGYMFVWRYYNKKVRAVERDGGLWFRTCDSKFADFDKPRRLTADKTIPSGAMTVCTFEKTAVIVWADGISSKTQKIRYVRFNSRSDQPKPGEFAGPRPDHLLPMKSGLLVLSNTFCQSPYCWTLRSRRVEAL